MGMEALALGRDLRFLRLEPRRGANLESLRGRENRPRARFIRV